MNIYSPLSVKEKERLRDFVSGLMAGIISVTVCNPLDIARTRLNVMVHHWFYLRARPTTMAIGTPDSGIPWR